jgi:hypothetical protein
MVGKGVEAWAWSARVALSKVWCSELMCTVNYERQPIVRSNEPDEQLSFVVGTTDLG